MIDFLETDPGFLLYTAMVGLSGLAMIVLAILKIGNRPLNGILGTVSLGFALNLVVVFFRGGEFWAPFYMFALPFIAAYQLIAGLRAQNDPLR
jgi:hypothetical protein